MMCQELHTMLKWNQGQPNRTSCYSNFLPSNHSQRNKRPQDTQNWKSLRDLTQPILDSLDPQGYQLGLDCLWVTEKKLTVP